MGIEKFRKTWSQIVSRIPYGVWELFAIENPKMTICSIAKFRVGTLLELNMVMASAGART